MNSVDEEKVYIRAKELKGIICMMLTTLSYWYHDDGNREPTDLIEKREDPQNPAIGGPGEVVDFQTQYVADGDL